MPDSEIVELLESLPSRRLEEHVWRHMFGNHRPEQVNTRGARWNPPGVGAIYVSMERETAIAEGQHAIDIQPLRPKARRVVYECELAAIEIVDLTDSTLLTKLNITKDELGADDFGACQKIGAAAAWLGIGGLIVPSARAEGSNVVVLVDAADEAPELSVISSEVIFEPRR